MTSTWKPEGYPTVSPYLIVEDAESVTDRPTALAFDPDTLRSRQLGANPSRRQITMDPHSLRKSENRAGTKGAW